MSRIVEWGIEIFWKDSDKMGDLIVDKIFFEYDFETIKNLINVYDYDPNNGALDGAYELNKSNIEFFEKLLNRKFDLDTYVYDISSYGYVENSNST